MADAHQREDQDLAADTLEADLAGELVVRDCAHDTRQVVERHEDQERIKQTVTAAEEPAKPAADCCEDELNGVPEFFHGENLLFA